METDMLFRVALKRGMAHLVNYLQQSTSLPCKKTSSSSQIQMAFQKGGRKERR